MISSYIATKIFYVYDAFQLYCVSTIIAVLIPSILLLVLNISTLNESRLCNLSFSAVSFLKTSQYFYLAVIFINITGILILIVFTSCDTLFVLTLYCIYVDYIELLCEYNFIKLLSIEITWYWYWYENFYTF